MNRRLMTMILATAMIGLSDKAFSAEFDQYGGWKAKPFEATGFFKTHHDGTRWWLVTPEGNAFLSIGMNHMHAGFWRAGTNKDYWAEKWGAESGPKWSEGFVKYTKEAGEGMGFNTMGYHCESREYNENPRIMPYMIQFLPIKLSYHTRPDASKYKDIFSDEYEVLCENAAQKIVAPAANDPLVLGYVMSDVPVYTDAYSERALRWTKKDMPGWARVLRNLGGHAPGKKAYVNLIKKRYGNIGEFNKVYGTAFGTWDDLLAAKDWRPKTDMENAKEIADNLAFVKLALHRYYSVAKAAIRKYDKNHLFFGDKINGPSPHQALKHVFEVSLQYTDAIYYQAYGNVETHRQWHKQWAKIADKPLINGDGGFGSRHNPKRMKVQRPAAETMEGRAKLFVEYAKMSFSDPNYVGWHVCGFLELWAPEGGPLSRSKPGLMDPFGKPFPEMEQAMATISSHMYKWATHGEAPVMKSNTVFYEGPWLEVE